MNLPVIDLDAVGSGGNAQGSVYVGTYINYNDLVANHPTSNFGDFAVVENDQGIAWLLWIVGGTYYPEGTYYWNNTEWTSNVADIAEELQNLIDSSNNVFEAYDSVGNLNVNFGTPVIVPLGTTVVSDSLYTLAANRVTVSKTGLYKISYGYVANNTSVDRVGLEGEIFVNAVAIARSSSISYSRGNPDTFGRVPLGSGSIPPILVSLTAADIVDVRVGRAGTRSAATRLVANKSWLTMEFVR